LGVETFTLRGPNTELTAEGWLGESRLDVKAQGSMDVRLLESFAPDLENTAGRLQLGVSARGAREAPLLVGTAELRDARFSLRDRQIAVRGLSGKVEFSETRVLVQDVGGQLNDGRFTVGGDVELDRFKPRRVQLSARLDDVSFRPAEDLPVRMGGELLLHGRPQAMVLSGDLNLLKLRYERPFVLDDVAGGLKREGGGGGDRPSEWLSFDVRFHTRGDVRVDNNLANARLVGDVTLTGTNLNPGLLGRIEAAGGSQAYFRGNQFRVSQGVLEFRERHRVDAVMDVQAETQVREYLVRLHAFGRTRQPSIILSSEPALSEADILSLLTVGVTSRDRSNTAGTGAAIATEAFLNASGLDRQLQRFIPKNALLRDVSFHISSAYNDITGSVEPTAQLESKFLTEQLKLGMSQPVSISGRGTRARAEYQFDPRLSAQAQWDNEHSDSAFGNLGLDLKLRWETE
ncbi:MAG TPA: translocation/assembly module TamB domain-containing protein, partial [Myxococcaceae bacterium]|nr:translocation/assembly module TamB domain-containing protein [Myxococcaceae bacterium]